MRTERGGEWWFTPDEYEEFADRPMGRISPLRLDTTGKRGVFLSLSKRQMERWPSVVKAADDVGTRAARTEEQHSD